MSEIQKTVTPIDNSIVVERQLLTPNQVKNAIEKSKNAFVSWKTIPLSERIKIVTAFVDNFVSQKDVIAQELTLMMGRPSRFTPGEVRGFEERARYLLAIAKEALKDIEVNDADKLGFKRYIKREPLGPILVISPWNFPYLVSVNVVIPAILAGNTVLLKPSPQTPLAAERFQQAFHAAGLPNHVFQVLHLSHEDVPAAIQDANIAFISFTGSVENGRMVQKAASGGFAGVALELGGKDPAYVAEDAEIKFSAENLVDGAYFNSGQSCCGIERIYVHEKVYDQFVDEFVKTVKEYKLGDPRDQETTLGPVISVKSADNIRSQIKEALEMGAKTLIDSGLYPLDKPGSTYLTPQVVVDVNHDMRLMKEESFGPVVGIMKVSSDQEAIKLMNDSIYGLTASIWTTTADRAVEIGDQIETGTVFMNRCDYLDPALAWVGVKESGRGVSLSKFGFDQLTRPKSYHLKLKL